MVSALSPGPMPVRLSRRVVEWGLMSAVVLVLVLTFLGQARVVQGQAELAAIRTTVGTLRTAFVLRYLHDKAAGTHSSVAMAQRNPFNLLQSHPANYRGEMTGEQAVGTAPGSWWYDPGCACVEYVPMHPQWLDSPDGATSVRYRVTTASGPAQLVAMQAYRWQDKALD